jgi:hypothetical protein
MVRLISEIPKIISVKIEIATKSSPCLIFLAKVEIAEAAQVLGYVRFVYKSKILFLLLDMVIK